MKTFKQFLQEEQPIYHNVQKEWDIKTPSVDADELKSYLQDKLGKSTVDDLIDQLSSSKGGEFPSGPALFRGFLNSDNLKDVFELDSTHSKRHSRDTNNLYQLMMSEALSSSGVPDRSNSVICSTSVEKAARFGKTYVILPLPNVKKIAYAPTEDIFQTSIRMGNFSSHSTLGPPQISSRIHHVLQGLGYDIGAWDGGKYTDVGAINAAFAKADPKTLALLWSVFFVRASTFDLLGATVNEPAFSLLHDMNSDAMDGTRPISIHTDTSKEIFRDALAALKKPEVRSKLEAQRILKTYDAVLKFAQENRSDFFTKMSKELMDADGIDIKVVSSASDVPHGVECWFSGKCVAVSIQMIRAIL